MWTVILLVCSNLFMTIAWYGHLKFKGYPLATVILASWLIALPEYALQVPANRHGHGQFTPSQLKILQEVITLVVFLIFAWVYFGEKPNMRTAGAFAMILGAVFLVFWEKD